MAGDTRADSYVYVVFRPDGQPCYVGKGIGRRWSIHLRRSPNLHLRSIITAAAGIVPIVLVRQGLTDTEAQQVEIALIKAIGRESRGGPLVNQTDGGDGQRGRCGASPFKGRKHSDAARLRIAESNRAAHAAKGGVSKETRTKISIAKTGVPLSEEARKKNGEAKKGNRYRRGSKHTDESIMRMRIAHIGQPSPNKGRPMSEEQKQKISIARKGVGWTQARRQAQEMRQCR